MGSYKGLLLSDVLWLTSLARLYITMVNILEMFSCLNNFQLLLTCVRPYRSSSELGCHWKSCSESLFRLYYYQLLLSKSNIRYIKFLLLSIRKLKNVSVIIFWQDNFLIFVWRILLNYYIFNLFIRVKLRTLFSRSGASCTDEPSARNKEYDRSVYKLTKEKEIKEENDVSGKIIKWVDLGNEIQTLHFKKSRKTKSE